MEIDAEYANVSLGALPVARVKTQGGMKTAEASFHNGLGHLMGAVNWDTGTVSAAFVYGPYGEVLESIGGELDDHLRRFNGKEADQLSKLSYYGYRYYDELSLSWTQADPLFLRVPDLAGANPRDATLYAFSLNNPVRYMDPDGLQSTATTTTDQPEDLLDDECPPGLGTCGHSSIAITDESGSGVDWAAWASGANGLTNRAMAQANAAYYAGGGHKRKVVIRSYQTRQVAGYDWYAGGMEDVAESIENQKPMTRKQLVIWTSVVTAPLGGLAFRALWHGGKSAALGITMWLATRGPTAGAIMTGLGSSITIQGQKLTAGSPMIGYALRNGQIVLRQAVNHSHEQIGNLGGVINAAGNFVRGATPISLLLQDGALRIAGSINYGGTMNVPRWSVNVVVKAVTR